jgi:nitrite reductase/ring-hydroxylating ferredoxin subunit
VRLSNASELGQGNFVTVATEDEVHEGSMLGVAVAGNPILLSKIGGKIYATDAVCSHYYGYLPKGELRDHTVVCPVHKAQYDVATGKVVKNVSALMKLGSRREATDLRTFEVEVVGDNVRVKVSGSGGPVRNGLGD